MTTKSHSSIHVGIISDTHGLLRSEAINALQGSQAILHAGDVGTPDVLDRLRAIAPLIVVRGNVDKPHWASGLPQSELVETGGFGFTCSTTFSSWISIPGLLVSRLSSAGTLIALR